MNKQQVRDLFEPVRTELKESGRPFMFMAEAENGFEILGSASHFDRIGMISALMEAMQVSLNQVEIYRALVRKNKIVVELPDCDKVNE